MLMECGRNEKVTVREGILTYLKALEEYKAEPGWPDISTFEAAVTEEIKRLIRVRVYSGRDWTRELGPIPDELKSKRLQNEQ